MAGRPKSPLVVGRCEACGMNFIRPSHRIGPFCSKTCSDRHSSTTHGMSRSPEYQAWTNIKQRCFIPQTPNYDNYGGRGITVCKRWLECFENFWVDMQVGYRTGLELDRKDNSLGYFKENCHWVSRKINSNNRRKTHLIETPLGIFSVAIASRLFGIKNTTLLYRIHNNWPPEKYFIKPDFKNKECMTSKTVGRDKDS